MIYVLSANLAATAMASAAYIAASVNRFSHAADSSNQSLVAFGSSKFVALWTVDVSANLYVCKKIFENDNVPSSRTNQIRACSGLCRDMKQ